MAIPIFALADCNNFYVSGERGFRPSLVGRLVAVLSNNDGCIIARSEEAKALGFAMGDPYHLHHEQLTRHGVHVFNSNYALNGDMSRRVMDTLADHTPEIELYSIDEAFLNLAGFERRGLTEYARLIQATVRRHTGIPVSIGIGPTKTLAKVANHVAKTEPDAGGVYDLAAAGEVDRVLASVEVGEVWGVGRRWAAWLAGQGIITALDLIPGAPALGATEAGRARFYALVPCILGIHVGLPPIVLGIRGELFSPNNGLEGASRYWLGLAEIGVGLGLLYGALTRLVSGVLAGTWIVGIGLIGLKPMLENLHYLGFAAFFFPTGRGPYAIDRLLFPALRPPPALARRAMSSLRVATGLSLIVVAFTEKLANPQLAMAFLQHYPLNFTPWIGLPMFDERFALCAGTTELVIGLWTVFGLFPRVIIATAWIFINLTLTVFNWVEHLGHLPLYGVMAVLLIWTPTEEDQRLWVRGHVWA